MNFEFTGILLRAANGNRKATCKATTLLGACTELVEMIPSMRKVLLDNKGKLRTAHRVVLNGELIPHPTDTMPLSADDRVEFFTAVAGG
jgi:molybdopterin converting factor small subunit